MRVEAIPGKCAVKVQTRAKPYFTLAKSNIPENPVRAGLVIDANEWKWHGAVLPGYPEVHPLEGGSWPLFWKLYAQHREATQPPPLPPF